MKYTVFLAGWLAAGIVAAADSGAIYHAGWTDLNKDGRKNCYEDPAQPVEKRIADLLRRMTLDEKIGQLWQVDLPHSLDPQAIARLRRGEVGSFLGSDATVERQWCATSFSISRWNRAGWAFRQFLGTT